MGCDRGRTGRRGEEHAAAHYRRLGYEVLERNARTRFGEIDLILRGHGHIVFCEVRTRVEGRGNPVESFGSAKARQVRRLAAHWLAGNHGILRSAQVRLDAAAVTVTTEGVLVRLEVFEGAL